MTAATNLTIKKNDGTTDIVWSLMAASGGDKSPAVWRSTTATGTAGQQPFMSMQSRDNGDKTARRTDMTFVYPSVYTDAASGLTKVRSKSIITVSAVLPLDTASADVLEQAAQFAHLLGTSLLIGSLQAGYSPT